MSIKGLEKIRELYFKEAGVFEEINKNNLVDYFMKTTIDTLKSQSDQIADLQKELAKKEDIFDVSEVKEVRNLNKFICDNCVYYDGKYCMLHLEYGEVCEKDTCKDYAEGLNV